MLSKFRYAELMAKGISSPLKSYCERSGVSLCDAILKTHARIDRDTNVGVANFLLFRTNEIRTGFEEAARTNAPASGAVVQAHVVGVDT